MITVFTPKNINPYATTLHTYFDDHRNKQLEAEDWVAESCENAKMVNSNFVADPGHAHAVYDPGHCHSIGYASFNTASGAITMSQTNTMVFRIPKAVIICDDVEAVQFKLMFGDLYDQA